VLHGVLEASLHGSQAFVCKLWINKADILKKGRAEKIPEAFFRKSLFFQPNSLYYKELDAV
jgi:hypothetical protein